jgi:hypothetical protein
VTGRSATTSSVQADVRSLSCSPFSESRFGMTQLKGSEFAANGYCTVKLVLAPAIDAAPVTVVPYCA